MKKIIAMLTLALAFTVSANAQDKQNVKPGAATEAAAGQKFLSLDQNKAQILQSLLDYKYTIKNDPKSSEKMKKELPWAIEKKLEGFLSADEMKKLRSNKELFLQITQ